MKPTAAALLKTLFTGVLELNRALCPDGGCRVCGGAGSHAASCPLTGLATPVGATAGYLGEDTVAAIVAGLTQPAAPPPPPDAAADLGAGERAAYDQATASARHRAAYDAAWVAAYAAELNRRDVHPSLGGQLVLQYQALCFQTGRHSASDGGYHFD